MVASRMHAFVKTWPRWQAHAFVKYLHAAGFVAGQTRTPPRNARDNPFWWLLPGWLFDSFMATRRKRSIPSRFLGDILWGQYCLFLFLRIQDDTCDGNAKERSLLYIGNEFLLEAEREFSNYFDVSSQFWQFYRKSMQDTFRAGVEIERLQQNRLSNPTSLIDAYAQVGHAFAIAPFALCTLLGPDNSANCALRFTEGMTVAGQIMDDLDDIHQDLTRNRYNYCTLILLHGEKRLTLRGEKAYPQIYNGLVRSEGLNDIFDEVRLHLSSAKRSIRPLRLPAAEALIHDYRKGLDILSDTIHHRRVNTLLGRFRKVH